MAVRSFRIVSLGVMLLASLVSSTAMAQATATPVQTLDRVDMYNQANVLDMEFEDPGRSFDFTALNVTPASATGFLACQITATGALYCIDGKVIRYWAKPAEAAGVGQPVLDCSDPGLGLQESGFYTCSGITVDISGNLWIVGKATASTNYLLYKIIPKQSGSCATGAPLSSAYCAIRYGSYNGFVTDLSSVDGDVGAAFAGIGVSGSGILALSGTQCIQADPSGAAKPCGVNGSAVLYFSTAAPGNNAPVTIAGPARWDLAPGESLQAASLVQTVIGVATRNFVVATTTASRIRAVDAATQDAAFDAFDIGARRAGTTSNPGPGACTAAGTDQVYGLRASSKSGLAYLSDRNYCQAIALQVSPTGNAAAPFQFVNYQEDGANLTFSTTAAYPTTAVTLAPGVTQDLVVCSGTCVLLRGKDGKPAATLTGVQLASSQSGMNLFQVKNIPDCRWNPAACRALGFAAGNTTLVYDKNGVGVRLDSPALGTAAANQYFLNVTPLLPREITDQFVAGQPPPAGLPKMLISPQYRGQQQNNFVFEALFGIPEQGVVFKQTFSGEFDVCRLTGGETLYNPDGSWKGCAAPGKELGCGYDYSESKKPNRAFDVTTTVSEKFITAVPGALNVATSPIKYIDTMNNTGCYNPTKIAGDRWSMYSYNLEVAPNTDAVFAKLLVSLYDDIEETRAELACKQVDTTATSDPPLSKQVCANLKKLWGAGKEKLDKCYSASVQPKSSAGSENCQAFASQLKLYQDALNAATVPPASQDPANRLGELKARVLVISHVYKDRFLPSIPQNGFTNQ